MMQVRSEPSLLGKLFALIITAILLTLGLMFSMVLLAIVAVVGIAAFGYFWWRTRALRKAMREHPLDRQPGGQIIEGEAIVVEEHPDQKQNALPQDSPIR
jgi:uncharacterized membrane protein